MLESVSGMQEQYTLLRQEIRSVEDERNLTLIQMGELIRKAASKAPSSGMGEAFQSDAMLDLRQRADGCQMRMVQLIEQINELVDGLGKPRLELPRGKRYSEAIPCHTVVNPRAFPTKVWLYRGFRFRFFVIDLGFFDV